MGDIPDWAIEKATKLRDDGYDREETSLATFARYITAHEEPPVDPLVLEAREIVAGTWEKRGSSIAAGQYRSGMYDACGGPSMQIAMACLKRGMELAREGGAK